MSTTRSKLNSVFSSKTKSFGPSKSEAFAMANLSDNTNWQEWSPEAHVNNLAEGLGALSDFGVKCFYKDLYTKSETNKFFARYKLAKANMISQNAGDLYRAGHRFSLNSNWLDGLVPARWAINNADTAIFTLYQASRASTGAREDGVGMIMMTVDENPPIGGSNAAIGTTMPDFSDINKATRPENGDNPVEMSFVVFEPDCMTGGIDNWYRSMLQSLWSLRTATDQDGVSLLYPELTWTKETDDENDLSLIQTVIEERDSGVQAG